MRRRLGIGIGTASRTAGHGRSETRAAPAGTARIATFAVIGVGRIESLAPDAGYGTDLAQAACVAKIVTIATVGRLSNVTEWDEPWDAGVDAGSSLHMKDPPSSGVTVRTASTRQ